MTTSFVRSSIGVVQLIGFILIIGMLIPYGGSGSTRFAPMEQSDVVNAILLAMWLASLMAGGLVMFGTSRPVWLLSLGGLLTYALLVTSVFHTFPRVPLAWIDATMLSLAFVFYILPATQLLELGLCIYSRLFEDRTPK